MNIYPLMQKKTINVIQIFSVSILITICLPIHIEEDHVDKAFLVQPSIGLVQILCSEKIYILKRNDVVYTERGGQLVTPQKYQSRRETQLNRKIWKIRAFEM